MSGRKDPSMKAPLFCSITCLVIEGCGAVEPLSLGPLSLSALEDSALSLPAIIQQGRIDQGEEINQYVSHQRQIQI